MAVERHSAHFAILMGMAVYVNPYIDGAGRMFSSVASIFDSSV